MSSNTILVVEDDATVREAVVDILEFLDADVIEAVNGKDGVEKFEAFRPKAVILDMFMPVMDGIETFHRLREMQPCLRIAISSGQGSADTMASFEGESNVYFLQKPYDIGKLDSMLKTLLAD